MSGTFPPSLFAGRRFVVVGLGRNGLPAAQALAGMGATVTAWDDNEAARNAAKAAGITIRDPLAQGFDGAEALVLSPGIPHRLPKPHPIAAAALAAGLPILSDAELLYAAVRAAGSKARFVGITGTNGKSTTTALLAHIVALADRPVAAGGNLGPASLALPLLPDSGVYVLEMSSYMLERLATIRFDIATMLNLTPDHIDRHGDMAGYIHAKRGIFSRQTQDDVAIVGIDDAPSLALSDSMRPGPARPVMISGRRAADVWCGAGVLVDPAGPILRMSEAPALPGSHNAQNAAAAAAMALALGIDRRIVARGIASFPGLAHRQERVGTVEGVAFVNDSKATNADATERALACYDRVIWIAGGIAKAGGIEPLEALFPRVARAFLIGQDAPVFAATLSAHGVANEVAGTLDAAVPAAFAAARAGEADVVLLSPACASFDQFSGFEARGDRFAQLVAALGQLHPGSFTPAERAA